MSGDIHAEAGSAVAGARSNLVAQSGKCSSILEYLDTVSGDPPTRGYTRPVSRVPDMIDIGTSSMSLSSTSTSPQQQRRRRRRRHTSGEESKLGGGETRAPWDNSIKDNKAVKKASSIRDSHGDMSSVNKKLGGREAADIRQRSQPSTARGRTAEAAHDSMANRPHRGVGNRLYSANDSGNLLPLSSADLMANGGGTRGSSEQTLGYISSTAAGKDAPTAMVGGTAHEQRQRRWVWDEWDDNMGDGSSSLPSCLRDQTSVKSGSRIGSNESPVAPRLSPSARTVAGSVDESLPSKRDKNETTVDLDDDECTPAARQAFEDIQATAQSMKANLKQKRSEV